MCTEPKAKLNFIYIATLIFKLELFMMSVLLT